MDAKRADLEGKLEGLLAQASSVAAEIQAIDQGDSTPHYDQIELPAHETGKRLSRMIQTARARDVAAENVLKAPCPDCGKEWPVDAETRQVRSMDGPIELTETVSYCRCCRRLFFPSA
ncbi:MAG: hypothetical protein AAF497_28935 [Planctomycetota bacterium]